MAARMRMLMTTMASADDFSCADEPLSRVASGISPVNHMTKPGRRRHRTDNSDQNTTDFQASCMKLLFKNLGIEIV